MNEYKKSTMAQKTWAYKLCILKKNGKRKSCKGIRKKKNGEETKYYLCVQGKLTRTIFNYKIKETTHILQRLQVDLFEQIKVRLIEKE